MGSGVGGVAGVAGVAGTRFMGDATAAAGASESAVGLLLGSPVQGALAQARLQSQSRLIDSQGPD